MYIMYTKVHYLFIYLDTWSLLPSMNEKRAQFALSSGQTTLGAFGGHGHNGPVATDTYEFYAYEELDWKLENATLEQSIFNVAVVSVSSELPIFPDDC